MLVAVLDHYIILLNQPPPLLSHQRHKAWDFPSFWVLTIRFHRLNRQVHIFLGAYRRLFISDTSNNPSILRLFRKR